MKDGCNVRLVGPTLGINPMMTVEAIAYMVAEGICARWKDQPLPAGPDQAGDSLSTTLLIAANATCCKVACESEHTSHSASECSNKRVPIEVAYDQ